MSDPNSNHLILPGSFLLNLDPVDLKRLRKITRRAAQHRHLTDYECDMIIEEYGPKAAVDSLRKEVKNRYY